LSGKIIIYTVLPKASTSFQNFLWGRCACVLHKWI